MSFKVSSETVFIVVNELTRRIPLVSGVTIFELLRSSELKRDPCSWKWPVSMFFFDLCTPKGSSAPLGILSNTSRVEYKCHIVKQTRNRKWASSLWTSHHFLELVPEMNEAPGTVDFMWIYGGHPCDSLAPVAPVEPKGSSAATCADDEGVGAHQWH